MCHVQEAKANARAEYFIKKSANMNIKKPENKDMNCGYIQTMGDTVAHKTITTKA